MSFETIWFIRAALIYLGVGVVLGLTMAIHPNWMLYIKPAHAHLNLLGFMAMFVYGIAYHVLPRFRGKLLYSPKLARMHLILANVGLVGMASAFGLRFTLGTAGTWALAAFGTLEVVAVGMFIVNAWKTLE
ncbi:Cytochrome C and Quinol oxidase polypeptide I [compost metagenome]